MRSPALTAASTKPPRTNGCSSCEARTSPPPPLCGRGSTNESCSARTNRKTNRSARRKPGSCASGRRSGTQCRRRSGPGKRRKWPGRSMTPSTGGTSASTRGRRRTPRSSTPFSKITRCGCSVQRASCFATRLRCSRRSRRSLHEQREHGPRLPPGDHGAVQEVPAIHRGRPGQVPLQGVRRRPGQLRHLLARHQGTARLRGRAPEGDRHAGGDHRPAQAGRQDHQIQGGMNVFLQADAARLPFANDAFDLVLGSPPYADARTYGIGAQREADEWVEWMLNVTKEATRVSKGLVLWVAAGVTRDWCYWPCCEGLMWEWFKRGDRLWRTAR